MTSKSRLNSLASHLQEMNNEEAFSLECGATVNGNPISSSHAFEVLFFF